jgi:hypothetical protein
MSTYLGLVTSVVLNKRVGWKIVPLTAVAVVNANRGSPGSAECVVGFSMYQLLS